MKVGILVLIRPSDLWILIKLRDLAVLWGQKGDSPDEKYAYRERRKKNIELSLCGHSQLVLPLPPKQRPLQEE